MNLTTDKPRELTVSDAEYSETLRAVTQAGGRVHIVERVQRCNGVWKLRIFWPTPKQSPLALGADLGNNLSGER